jgi:diacylglycerol O-acyltransferase
VSATVGSAGSPGKAVLDGWGRESRMNDLEALMWRGERHPEFSSCGVIVEQLDSVPDWARFRRAHERGVAAVPRLRSRVVEPAVPTGPPMWVDEHEIDLDYHVRRLRLPEPAGERELLDAAREFGLEPMDRSRPLWSGILVENLAGGRAAYLLKAHHCLMDGAAAIALFSAMHSDRAEPSLPADPLQLREVPEVVDPRTLALHDLAHQVRQAPVRTARALAAVASAVRAPGRVVEFAGSVRRVLSPPAGATASPLTASQSGRDWQYGTLECSLADLKAAARAAHGSVNDAYIAALLGGLRRYHETMGIEIGDIPIAMPVSIRRPDEGPGGNRFAAALLAGPAGEVDPVERIASIRGAVLTARAEPAMDVLGVLAPVVSRAPAQLLDLALQGVPRVDLSASNVPGLTTPAFAAGARVERMHVFGPLPSAAMLATLISYVGTCCIGINCDGAVFTDTELLWQCMQAGLDEVLALAGPDPHSQEES